MKKTLCLVLSLILAVSLCACSGGPSPEEQDYEPAKADTEPTKPELIEVKITMDNYLDYFNIDLMDYWNVNNFGEGEDLIIFYGLTIKDDYSNRLTNLENTQIDIECKYSTTNHKCEYDLKNMTYTIQEPGEPYFNESNKTQVSSFTGDDLLNHPYGSAPIATSSVFYYMPPDSSNKIDSIRTFDDIEILRIQGSIFLTE